MRKRAFRSAGLPPSPRAAAMSAITWRAVRAARAIRQHWRRRGAARVQRAASVCGVRLPRQGQRTHRERARGRRRRLARRLGQAAPQAGRDLLHLGGVRALINDVLRRLAQRLVPLRQALRAHLLGALQRRLGARPPRRIAGLRRRACTLSPKRIGAANAGAVAARARASRSAAAQWCKQRSRRGARASAEAAPARRVREALPFGRRQEKKALPPPPESGAAPGGSIAARAAATRVRRPASEAERAASPVSPRTSDGPANGSSVHRPHGPTRPFRSRAFSRAPSCCQLGAWRRCRCPRRTRGRRAC